MAADAISALDAFDAAHAIMVGLSMGAGIAQQIASSYPDRVAGLVLVSASPAVGIGRDLPPSTPEILATFETSEPEPDWEDRGSKLDWVVNIERPYADPGTFEESSIRELIGAIWDRTPSMASATNHFIVADGGAEIDLRALRDLPTLIIHGSADPLFPLPHKESLLFPGPLAEAVSYPDYRGNRWRLAIPRDHLKRGRRVVLIDDWIETGNQALAAGKLIAACGATHASIAVIVDQGAAETRDRLPPIRSLLTHDELPLYEPDPTASDPDAET